jgi:hypothetical protein
MYESIWVGMYVCMNVFICKLWHVDPLLGGDREIGGYTAAVAEQRPADNNEGTVFSAWSAKQCLDTAGEQRRFQCGPWRDVIIKTTGALSQSRAVWHCADEGQQQFNSLISQSRVLSLQLGVGGETRWRSSQTVAPWRRCVESSREIGASQRGPEAWKTEAEESTTLWNVTKQWLVETRQIEKFSYVLWWTADCEN